MKLTDIKNNIPPIIKKQCSQFIKECNGKNLYRGMKEIEDMISKRPRPNRSPMSTPKTLHNLLNEGFEDVWGYKYRSAMFCTPKKEIASLYGTVYKIYPVNGYSYIWSPIIRDLTSMLMGGSIAKLKKHLDKQPKFKQHITELLQLLDKYEARNINSLPIKAKQQACNIIPHLYMNTDIHLNTTNEVMIKCTSYYGIKNN